MRSVKQPSVGNILSLLEVRDIEQEIDSINERVEQINSSDQEPDSELEALNLRAQELVAILGQSYRRVRIQQSGLRLIS